MKRQSYLASNTDFTVCPCCGICSLDRGPQGVARCTRCDPPISAQLLETLEQIGSLPDVLGNHACEFGQPEMRRLDGDVVRCPACGSEVLPFSPSLARSEAGSKSWAYWCGWSEGLFVSMGSFASNAGLAGWEDPHQRLDYYRDIDQAAQLAHSLRQDPPTRSRPVAITARNEHRGNLSTFMQVKEDGPIEYHCPPSSRKGRDHEPQAALVAPSLGFEAVKLGGDRSPTPKRGA